MIISLVIPSRLTPCYMYKLYTHLTETILLIFEMSSVLLFCFCTKHPNYVQFLNYYEGAFLIVNPCPPPPPIFMFCVWHMLRASQRGKHLKRDNLTERCPCLRRLINKLGHLIRANLNVGWQLDMFHRADWESWRIPSIERLKMMKHCKKIL